MYEKDDNSYFIVDAHVALWDARPENQRNIHGKQFIDCFYDYHRNLSPESEVWELRRLPLSGRRAADERPVRPTATSTTRSSSPPRLGEFYYKGFGQTDEASALAAAHPDKLTYNHNFDPRNGEAGLDQLREDAKRVRPQGRQALHRRMARRLPRLAARRPVGLPVLRGVPRTRHPQHPRAQGPDHPAAGPRRLRRRRRRPRRLGLHRPELHRRALRAAAAGGLLLDRHPGAQRARRARGGDAVHPHPTEVLRADHGRAAVLDRRGPHPVLVGLRDLDAALAGRGVRRLPDPRGPRRIRADQHRPEEEDPRAQRRQDVRHPGARRAAAAATPTSRPSGPRGADDLVEA